MPFLIGTDEAGYGPNLGPLVVSATVWRVESLSQMDLFSSLSGVVRRAGENNVDESQIVIGDSKELYKPGKGLSGLEQGVLTCLAAIQKQPHEWKQIWEEVATEDCEGLSEIPWYHNYEGPLPVDLPTSQLSKKVEHFTSECRRAKSELTQIRSRVVVPERFNELVEEYGNKASALSHTTLQLVRGLLKEIPDDEPVHVLCDKHGGRKMYGPLLNETFPDTLAIVRHEEPRESAYQLGQGDARREFVFRAKADEGFLPSALASMLSKYLRELAMKAFNEFWVSRVDDLQPTAGYPVDAKRYKRQIAPVQKKLGIDDRMLWRCR